MIIEGTYENKTVRITFNGEDKPCHLHVRFNAPINMDMDRGEFNNPRSLSAQLRSELSYRDCCHLLYTNGVEKTSGLWALNHDGYPSENYLKEITNV
jgi:hypothetical protein